MPTEQVLTGDEIDQRLTDAGIDHNNDAVDALRACGVTARLMTVIVEAGGTGPVDHDDDDPRPWHSVFDLADLNVNAWTIRAWRTAGFTDDQTASLHSLLRLEDASAIVAADPSMVIGLSTVVATAGAFQIPRSDLAHWVRAKWVHPMMDPDELEAVCHRIQMWTSELGPEAYQYALVGMGLAEARAVQALGNPDRKIAALAALTIV